MASLFSEEFSYCFQCLGLCCFEVVINDDYIELWGIGEFFLCLCKTLLDDLWGISCTAYETTTKFLYRRWLYEYTKCFATKDFLEVATTLYVNVENHVLAIVYLVLNL